MLPAAMHGERLGVRLRGTDGSPLVHRLSGPEREFVRPCSGTSQCDVVANDDQFITATFNSTAPMQVAVPDVVGQTQAAATTAITNAGLVLGTMTQQASSTVASGNVISESPAAGANVSSGSTVNLVVCTGSSTGGGGYGGGGGIDSLTLGALLSALMATRRRGPFRSARPRCRSHTLLQGARCGPIPLTPAESQFQCKRPLF